MVGIVVVSHSEPLARAAVAVALEMAGDSPPKVRVAAGAAGGVTGTDAVAIARAIDEIATPAGVLVLMDLGSAVLSAEMARDLLTTDAPVLLSPAPFVEGLLSAVVLAGAGADLEAVAREAAEALNAKTLQLGTGLQPIPESDPDFVTVEATVINPSGLHARPAAVLVKAVRARGADVRIMNLATGAGPAPASSLIGLMSLAVLQGQRVRITATGEGAAEAAAHVERLITDGLGENAEPTAPATKGNLP